MHELSVATSLVDVVMAHLIESGGERVTRVVVDIGDLSGVVPAALRSAFVVARGTEPAMRAAKLELRAVAVTIACDACGERPASGPNDLRCSECGTPSMRVIRGRELDVVGIEVSDAAADA